MIKQLHIAYIFTFFGFIHSFAQESYNSLIYEGNKQFDRKNYERSAAQLMKALEKNPKEFSAHYNLGNALYKQKKYDEAKAEYEKASSLAQNKADQSAALYNQGNALMQTEQYEKAAEFYKKALKAAPYNEDIRRNYGIAKMKQQSHQNQKEEPQNQNQSQDQKGDNQKNGEGKENSKNQNKNQKGQQKNGSQGNENQGQGQQEPNPKTNDNKGKMPKEQHNAIMNRIEGKEQETARKILNKNSYSMPQSNEKDW